MVLPILSLGGSGVISVLANILPRQTHDMVMDYLNGDRQKALEAQLGLLDVINGLFLEVNPIPVKEAMNQMGMEVGGYRQPLGPMGEAAQGQADRRAEGCRSGVRPGFEKWSRIWHNRTAKTKQ